MEYYSNWKQQYCVFFLRLIVKKNNNKTLTEAIVCLRISKSLPLLSQPDAGKSCRIWQSLRNAFYEFPIDNVPSVQHGRMAIFNQFSPLCSKYWYACNNSHVFSHTECLSVYPDAYIWWWLSYLCGSWQCNFILSLTYFSDVFCSSFS